MLWDVWLPEPDGDFSHARVVKHISAWPRGHAESAVSLEVRSSHAERQNVTPSTCKVWRWRELVRVRKKQEEISSPLADSGILFTCFRLTAKPTAPFPLLRALRPGKLLHRRAGKRVPSSLVGGGKPLPPLLRADPASPTPPMGVINLKPLGLVAATSQIA